MCVDDLCHGTSRTLCGLEQGIPPAPKSSCWFCPFRSPESRRREARTQPERFQKSLDVERIITEKRRAMGRDEAWLSAAGPLARVASGDQQAWDFDGDPECDTGWCFT